METPVPTQIPFSRPAPPATPEVGTQRETHPWVDSLMGALGKHEADTLAHVEVVGDIAERFAAAIGFDADTVRTIGQAALLHDIGKLAVPVEILNKTGRLTEEEWGVMRSHTTVGEAILNSIGLHEVAVIVRGSHERWDGLGYPDGLAGESIPVGSRIVFICDAYQAMVQGRPYGAAVTQAEAFAELRAYAGTQFDPNFVDPIIELIETADAPAPRGPRFSTQTNKATIHKQEQGCIK